MYWDRVAGFYDLFESVANKRVYEETGQRVAKEIDAGDTVLECACGTGAISMYIAPKCRHLTATDFSGKMLERAKKNCMAFDNVTFALADITALNYPEGSFDKVVAGNVIHLLDEPLKALGELNRVCRDGGCLIIPTYMNRDQKGDTSGFASAVGKAGADFKRQFTVRSYRQFFLDAGYEDVTVTVAEGRIPCAVAIMGKRSGI